MPAVPKQRAVSHHRNGRSGDCRGRRWLLPLALLLVSALTASAQVSDVEIPYSSVFRESGGWANDPLQDFAWSADPNLKVGDNTLRFGGTGFDLGTSLDTPFRLSGPPQDAMFRLWRLYLNIPQTSLEVIASDNANQTHDDRESGVISAVTTDFDLYLQISDRLQLTAGGSYIYLPFEGTGGFQGSSSFAETMGADAGFNADLDLFLQATFDGTIGQWDYFVTDRYGIQNRESDLQANTNYDARLHYLQFDDFDKADRLGRYSLGGNYRGDYENSDDAFDDDSSHSSRWDYDTGGTYNQLSTGVSRLLPTDTRTSFTLFRRDTWDDTERQGNDHAWTHGLNVSLYNQHYNVRFKPYLTYTASTSSEHDYWSHVGRVGFAGPLSEYTDLNANVGHSWRTNTSDGESSPRSTLWHISLHNELNELTTHRLSYTRSIEEPNEEIHTELAYSIHRTLGPRLDGTLFATWTEEDESDGQGDGHDETAYNLGASLAWDASSRLTVRLTAFLAAVQEEDTDADYEEYHIRLSGDYQLSDTTSLMLSYEHTGKDDERPGRSYYENVVRARLTKRW